MKTLRVTADDFGLHPDVNRAILECAERGRLTAVSVMPAGAAPDWPLARRLAASGVAVGLHWTLCGEPWLTTGWRLRDWRALALRLAAGGGSFRRAVEAELREQVRRSAEAGLRLAHADSHQHVHVLPGLWALCRRVAAEAGVARLRVPVAASAAGVRRTPAGLALQALGRARARAVPGAAPCVGLAWSGRNTAARWLAELRGAAAEAVELVAHPGVATPDLAACYGWWGYDWDGERAALLGPEFVQGLNSLGWQLNTDH